MQFVLYVMLCDLCNCQRNYSEKSGSEGSEDDDYVPYVPVKIRKQQMVSNLYYSMVIDCHHEKHVFVSYVSSVALCHCLGYLLWFLKNSVSFFCRDPQLHKVMRLRGKGLTEEEQKDSGGEQKDEDEGLGPRSNVSLLDQHQHLKEKAEGLYTLPCSSLLVYSLTLWFSTFFTLGLPLS